MKIQVSFVLDTVSTFLAPIVLSKAFRQRFAEHPIIQRMPGSNEVKRLLIAYAIAYSFYAIQAGLILALMAF